VLEDVHPQIVHRALAHVLHQVRLEPACRKPDAEDQEVDGRNPAHTAQIRRHRSPSGSRDDVPVDRDAVQRRPDEIGERGDQQQRDRHGRRRAVGAYVPEQPSDQPRVVRPTEDLVLLEDGAHEGGGSSASNASRSSCFS